MGLETSADQQYGTQILWEVEYWFELFFLLECDGYAVCYAAFSEKRHMLPNPSFFAINFLQDCRHFAMKTPY